MKSLSMQVERMHCNGCADMIRSRIGSHPGVLTTSCRLTKVRRASCTTRERPTRSDWSTPSRRSVQTLGYRGVDRTARELKVRQGDHHERRHNTR